MQFQEVIGQNAVKKRLIEGVKEGRISHAQLFSGPEGVGKLPMALAYAQFINCRNRSEFDSCGECSSCRKYRKLIHPDLHFVFPVVKSSKFKDPVSDHYLDKWREQVLSTPYFGLSDWYNRIDVENAQGSIFVSESSEIIRKLNLKTYEADYKVMIIWMAERMNVQCANKLLKILEEPPPNTLFILITEEEEELLTTIRSRTQRVKFTGIEKEALSKALREIPESEGKDIKGLVHLARGSYVRARELVFSENENNDFFDRFTGIMRLAYKRDWMPLFAWVDEMAGMGREKQKSFFTYAMRMLRENFIFNLKQPDLVFLDEKEKQFSERFSPFINERNIQFFSHEFERAYRDIAQNGNPRIIFLDLSLKITKMIKA
ncbi:MAG TPA: DNA polymerase III subunit delta' [Prolixibacteraceae bacterium]|nr:DNA polymerase III subunit delta' [Prolixibacteraceae bacterium]